MYKLLFTIPLLLSAVYGKHEEVDGHALYKVAVQTLQQVELLHEVVERLTLDIWTYAVPGREGLILVSEDKQDSFQTELFNAGITYEIATQNIKEELELEQKRLAEAAAKSNVTGFGLSFDVIHSYEVVDRYLVDLANQYPNLVTVVSGGSSFEGRDIKYLRISTTNFQDRRKPVIMIQSLLHAREWVTLPASLYAIRRLVIDVTDRDLVDNVDWIILPIANPDGYEYSYNDLRTRFWRKNRATGFTPGDVCLGVDLNRNFDFVWGTASSNSPCSETFHGRYAFSEPETQVIRNIFNAHRGRIEMYIDIHSFGSMILYGFGTGQLPPNALTLNFVAVRMAQAIDAVKWPSKPNYIVGNIYYILYHVSGGSTDYAQATDIPLSFAFELPAFNNEFDTVLGFLVDPDFIEQAGYETWEGIKAGVRWVVANTRMKQ